MDKKSRTKVKVVIRVRPPLNGEEVISCVYPSRLKSYVEIFNHRNIKENLRYDFSTVYDRTATQKEVFDECVEPLLGNSFEGQNVSIFAYGPTGAGKTHTMLGSPNDPGIIPRAMNWMFEKCGTTSSEPNMPQTTITLSYLEIYNEKVRDLLSECSNDLPIREDNKHNIFVAALTEKVVDSFETFKSYFAPACSKRSVAATNLNEHSSRSHSIVLLKVTRKFKDTEYIGKVHLIDLAGSEDNRRTGNKGMRLKESGAINRSLFALGEVVDAINKNLARVPYRNSKLTRLLQDSLGGSCHSLMVTNIAPEEHYYYDTYCTLNFASKSKKIMNICTTNVHSLEPVSKVSLLKRNGSSDSNLLTHNHKKMRKEKSTTSIGSCTNVSSTSSSNITPSPWKSSVNEKIEELEKQINEFRDRVSSKEDDKIKTENNTLPSEYGSSLSSHSCESRRSSARLRLSTSSSSYANTSQSDSDTEKGVKNSYLKLSLVPVDSNDSSPDVICATPIISKRKNALKDKSNLFQNMFGRPKHKHHERLKRILDSGPSCSPLFQDFPSVKKRFSADNETPCGKSKDSVALSKLKQDPLWQEKRNEAFLTMLNSSSTKDLQQLHTVGAKRAKLIFEWRELHGPFLQMEALKEIPGFTSKYYEKFLKNNLITQ